MAPRRVLIDCDPGIDDALNLFLAFASPGDVHVEAVTVVFGNVGLERTVGNALALCELLGVDVPVYAGAPKALLAPRVDAAEYHGATGLGSVVLPPPSRAAAPGRAVEQIVERALARPGELTVVATGAMTNLALALRVEPRLADALAGIVVMAGSLGAGNTTPSAEFNAYADPHALKIVLDCGAPVTMFGLDVTHQVIASPARVQALRASGGLLATCAADLMTTFAEPYRQIYGWDGAAVHDVCTAAYLIDPTLFEVRAMPVEVDTGPGPGFGQTIGDVHGLSGAPANVHVATGVDADRFFALFTERVTAFDAGRA
jgi:purine nucleosidase